MRIQFLAITLLLSLVACKKAEESASLPPAQVTEAERIAAAQSTATNNTYCQGIIPFYWEIGNSTGVLVSASEGDGSVLRTTNFGIASSTKFVFGAYVVQIMAGQLDQAAIKALTMQSGYTNFDNLSCVPNAITTVNQCHVVGTNDDYSSSNLGKFYYNGGHFQKWAVDNSMGSLTESQLVTEFQSELGSDFQFTFGSPQLAGGINTNAENYSIFLRKILSGTLLMREHLGANAVCTLPATCAASVYSPFDKNFHYSYGHWVEDDPSEGDGAYSSAGLFGFYPWIDSTKSYYGIISRYELPGGSNQIGSGLASQLCGSRIRKAYLTGIAQ